MAKATTTKTATCRRAGCHATLRAPRSVAAGIGPTCARREREDAAAHQARHDAALATAVASVDTTPFKDPKRALDKAEQLLIDGGLVPTRFPGVYLATGSDGVSTYLTDRTERSCTCPAGARIGRCNHLLAADIDAILTELLAEPTTPALGLAA